MHRPDAAPQPRLTPEKLEEKRAARDFRRQHLAAALGSAPTLSEVLQTKGSAGEDRSGGLGVIITLMRGAIRRARGSIDHQSAEAPEIEQPPRKLPLPRMS